MKTLVVALFALAATVFVAQAQINLNYFTAREGYEYALEAAVDDELPNPKLLSILTIAGEIEDFQQINDFNFDTGEAYYWVYLFQESGNPENMRAYYVGYVSLMGVSTWQTVEEDPLWLLDLFPISPGYVVQSDNWMDSDDMIKEFLKYPYFADMHAQYPDPNNWITGIFTNEDNPQMPPNETFWGFSFVEGDDSLACVVHATEKYVICGTETGIPEKLAAETRVYPNPTSESAILKLPEELYGQKVDIEIMNAFGLTVGSAEAIDPATYRIEAKSLPPGCYALKVIAGKESYLKKFIILR